MLNLVLSDIHANFPALEAVLWDAVPWNVDRVICLGDMVGYGPFPKEVLRKLRAIEAECILGNHDIALLGLSSGKRPKSMRESLIRALAWQLDHLSPEDLQWLTQLPTKKAYGSQPGDRFLCSHGSPRSSVTYVDTVAVAKEEFVAWDGQLCFIGHTHLPAYFSSGLGPSGNWVTMQAIRDARFSLELNLDHRYLINSGSVGQPRDNDPRAAYGLYDDQTRVFRLCRVEYDVSETVKAIRKAGLDDVSAVRLTIGQ
ncbi:MAG: metallophosphoesterase family protein [Deinococcaceae bacterium]